MSDQLELAKPVSHICNIDRLAVTLQSSNVPLKNVSYRITKEQGIEFALEIQRLNLGGAFVERKYLDSYISAGIGWKVLDGAMWNGIKILIDDA